MQATANVADVGNSLGESSAKETRITPRSLDRRKTMRMRGCLQSMAGRLYSVLTVL